MQDPLLLSVSEAAKKLGLGQGTVRALMRTGEIASVSVGRRNRKIPAKALEEYVRTATVQS